MSGWVHRNRFNPRLYIAVIVLATWAPDIVDFLGDLL